MKLVIPIKPKAQTRPKFNKWSGAYDDPKMKAWRKSCAYLVSSLYTGKRFEGALKTKVTFYLKAPKDISDRPGPRARKKKKDTYQRFIDEKIYVSKKPDLDNLEKALYDSISDSGKVWHDDNQIVEHTTRKLYSPNPRIEIEIEEVL